MWTELWERHRGKLLGTAGGLFLSVIYLFFGFWDMLIVAFIIGLGYGIGKQADERKLGLWVEDVVGWMNERWRMFK